jgi:lipopolysaccharide transport system ATP-binding protein
MSTPIIEIKNIGKKYNIAHQRGKYTALRDVLTNILKSPFKFLIKKTKAIAGIETKEEFWALKNINFNIEKGEVVGIIGRNGAGKSTLLKILSQITPPTEGEIIINGRVGSLLEVGTGFHPELTGRENIFLNGAILGMSGKEIAQKFDKIVEFSGVEKFLDTPVKYYSSGMYVRLAFSVAAHMEPDILIIDEVLAVGDADFQKKCLGKINEIAEKDGRTILFVSHNLEAIKKLCKKTIFLNEGRVQMVGETNEVLNVYTDNFFKINNIALAGKKRKEGNGKIKIVNFSLRDSNDQIVPMFACGQDVQIWLDYEVFDNNVNEINLAVGIESAIDQRRIAIMNENIIGKKINLNSKKRFKIKINNLPLNVGKYQFSFHLSYAGEVFDAVDGAGMFEVVTGHFYASGNLPPPEGQGNLLLNYDIID